jgi:hypothetical protein
MSRIRHSFIALIAIASAVPAFAAEKEAKKELTATLTSAQESYKLDAAQSGADFRKKLDPKNGNAPKASKVDLKLTLTNNTEKEIKFNYGGDETTIKFTLKGEGAVTIEPMMAMTMEYRMGNPTTIAPGKTFEIPIKSLAGGMRGVSQLSYFTEAGDYTLTATFHYNEGETPKTLTSDELKIKVTK